MKSIGEILEKLKDDQRYYFAEAKEDGTEIYDFRLERGVMTPDRLASFLAEFKGQDITVVSPEVTDLAYVLEKRGLPETARNLVKPEEYKFGSDIVILAGGMLLEEAIRDGQPEKLIRIGIDQYFNPPSEGRGVKIMKNFMDREMLVYQYEDTAKTLNMIPIFSVANFAILAEHLREGVYPGDQIKELTETVSEETEGLKDQLLLYSELFEKLRDIGYPFEKSDIDRYIVCNVIAQELAGKAGTEEDRKAINESVKDFYGNETVKAEEYRNRGTELISFKVDDPEANFLDGFKPYENEAKAALKLLRESERLDELLKKDIGFNEFFDIASKALSIGVVRNLGDFNKLRDTNRLALFIEDLYAVRGILGDIHE